MWASRGVWWLCNSSDAPSPSERVVKNSWKLVEYLWWTFWYHKGWKLDWGWQKLSSIKDQQNLDGCWAHVELIFVETFVAIYWE